MSAIVELLLPGLVVEGVHPVFEDEQTAVLRGLLQHVAALAEAGVGGVQDAHRVDQLRLLDQVKAATAAAQARITLAFERPQTRPTTPSRSPPPPATPTDPPPPRTPTPVG